MLVKLIVSPAYMTEEVGPIFGCLNCGFDERAASELRNVFPQCLTVGTNLCIKPYHIHHILIGGCEVFSGRLHLPSPGQGKEGGYASNRYRKLSGFGTCIDGRTKLIIEHSAFD